MPYEDTLKSAPQTGSKTSGEAAGFAKAAATRGPSLPSAPPKNLGQAPKYNLAAVQEHIDELRQSYRQAATILPSQVIRDREGRITQGWSPTMALNPRGEPLPWGAGAWDDRGEPIYGDPNDASLVGDFNAFFAKITSHLTNGTGDWRELLASNEQKKQEAQAILDTPVETEIVDGREMLKGTMFERDIRNISASLQKWSATGGALGAATKIGGAAFEVVTGAFGALQQAAERAGTGLLAAEELGKEAKYIPAIPDGVEQVIEKLRVLAPITEAAHALYLDARAVEAYIEGKWQLEDVEPVVQRAYQASRVAYSLWGDQARYDQALDELEKGADPRVVALRFENPTEELWGGLLNDPAILVGFAHAPGAIARAQAAAETRITSQKLLGVLAKSPERVGSKQWVRALADGVDDLYRSAEKGLVEQAGRRGFKVLTAQGKRFVATAESQKILGVIAKHFENDKAGMLEAVEAMARMASRDVAEQTLGIETMGRLVRQTGLPLEVVWSEEGARSGLVLRAMITDSGGKINPSATILRDIVESEGDAAKLAAKATERLESAYEKIFPTIEQQLKQADEYAKLLGQDEAKAARYLLQNPLATTEIPEFTRRLSSFYNALPRPVMNAMHSVQAAMYMVLSPGYFARNHLQNTFHILLDRGPGEAFRAFTFGGKAASDDLVKALGYVPEFAAGFGKAGAEAPSVMRLGGLALSARAEDAAGKVVVAGAVNEALEGAALRLPMEDLARLGDDNVRLLRYYIRSEKDVERGVARYLEAQGTSQRVLAGLTDEELTILGKHRSLRDVENILAGAQTRADIDNGVLAIQNEWDDLARREASGITIPAMSDAPRWEQEAMTRILADIPSEAADEAGLLAKQINANRVYMRDAAANAEEIYTKATTRRLNTLMAETEAGQDAAVALSAQGPGAAAARRSTNIENQVNQEISAIRQANRAKLDGALDAAYRESDNFRAQGWEWSDLSRDYANAGDGDGLARLWRQAGIPGVPPPEAREAARQFRGLFWQGDGATPGIYRQKQNIIWANNRDLMAKARQTELDDLVKLSGLSAEEAGGNFADKAQASLTRARILDQADFSGIPGLKPLVSGKDAADLVSFANGDDVLGDTTRNARRVIRANATAEERAAIEASKAAPKQKALWSRIEDASVKLPPEERAILKSQQFQDASIALRDEKTVEEAAAKISDEATKAKWLEIYNQELAATIAPPEELERQIAQRILAEEQRKAAMLDLLIAPQGDETLTASRMAAETRDGYKGFLEGLKQKLYTAFDGTAVGKVSPEDLGALNQWTLKAKGQWTAARASASEYARGVRKFTLLSYQERYGGDLVAGTIFPYHFWYSRTYANWAKRAVQNPYLISAYGQYRNHLNKVHAGMPDWWKYQLNTNELLGLDSKNPLWFNLEATLNPLQGIVGVDFNDRYRRIDGVSKTLDDLSKFGPGVWTGYSLALATAYLIQGKDDAAGRWAGRLTTATRTFRDITSLLGLNKGKGVEIDPLVLLYSGGLSPYDRNRVGAQAENLIASGRYSQAEVEQAVYEQSGPIWDEMVAGLTQDRAPGEIASWMFGTGFKPRTESDIRVDQMWADRMMVQSQMPNMSPEDRRAAWDELRSRYPFMDAILLARKGGLERDQAYTYLVLGRIPPGMSDDFARAVGIDYKLVSQFYDDPSALDNMALTDRNRFMAGIADIGAMLDVPPEATRAEWTEVRNRYGKIRTSIESAWGADIWDKIDVYYGKLGEDQKSRDAAQAYLDANPEVSEALDAQTASAMSDPLVGAYYSSLQKIERYWKGRMYDDIEKRLGADIWDKWNAYDDAKLEGKGKEYWKAHPELQEYRDIRKAWDPIVASQSAEFALRLPERESFRLRAEPVSLGQETIAGMQQQEAYRLTRQEWEQAMGPLLTNLVQDYLNGEDLPSAAKDRLTDVATNLGLPDNPLLVVELYQRSALAPAGP